MTGRYTDILLEQDDEGIWDLVFTDDETDIKVDDGLEAAIVTSLFSDRRAAPDEVTNPMRRRGWIGNLVAEVPGDNFGSGLWLYEQARLHGPVIAGVRTEAEQALDWMVGQGIVTSVDARVVADPESRRLFLAIDLTQTSGDETSRAYRLADATHRRIIARLGWE